MSALNWEQFAQLPGAATDNWERLCRTIVLRNFGSLGSFRTVAMQPGIEFYLKLEFPSGVLGEPDRWWGWQCRWYDFPASRQIGATRRKQVEEAIRKTEKHVPEVTDWVLWTRWPLTPSDQAWFYKIESSMRLHLWTEQHVDSHLVGDATILRRTYFGDLALTPDRLRDLRDQSLAPVRERWNPAVHVEVDAEHRIRRVLGEVQCWPEVGEAEGSLTTAIKELTVVVNQVEDELRGDIRLLMDDLGDLRTTFVTIARALANQELTQATAIEWNPRLTAARGRQLARNLRRARHPSSLAVQAALSRHYESVKLFATLRECLSTNFIAVIGAPGYGKTYLAAELTAARGDRPSGVYLEAWPLKRRGTINDLLARLRGLDAASFEDLLEAVESVGARTGVRIPIVIDGLNESEDPANWKGELEALLVLLTRFRHVVVVVTLRPSAEGIVLPSDCPRVELQGFASMTEEAICRYFAYYKIRAGGLRLPFERFRGPLFLRLFCEATNPDREVWIGPKDVPTSLIAVFARFRDAAVKRIANRPGSIRRYDQDIRKALDAIALSLWETNRRQMPFDELRTLIGDESADWTESLGWVLGDEGILGRDLDGDGEQWTAIQFDPFAGFVMADALARQRGRDDFAEWLGDERTVARLSTDPRQAHPLASDILKALVGLVPRKFHMQLWQLVSADLKDEALVDAAEIEGQLLDSDTVKEIGRVALLPRTSRLRDPFDRFRETRDAVGHPLNGDFLECLLSDQSVADRDLRWSEWIRRVENEVLSDVRAFADDWQVRTERTQEDDLRARWVKWILTSTVRHLRDHATRALYWYARPKPGALFRLALSSLQTNDPYVPERLLAAAFGVMMAAPGERRTFGDELADFLDGLWKAFCAETPTSPTDHLLMREYVEGIVEIARRYYPAALGEWTSGRRFAAPNRPDPILCDDERNEGGELVYGYDFKNYTVPRLVDRDSHDPSNNSADYQEVLSWIRARVWDLGWRADRFDRVEPSIIQSRRNYVDRPSRPDTYAKKYGWIGFFEAAGRLQDEGTLPLRPDEGRLSDVDIDPSFPAAPPTPVLTLPGWLANEPLDLQTWIKEGRVNVSDDLLRTESLGGAAGPWVALDGFLLEEDIGSKRQVFGFLRCMLVRREEEQQLKDALHERGYPGNYWLPEPQAAYYVFAGEMPWSSRPRQGWSAEELRKLYAGTVVGTREQEIAVEVPVHHYSWESYHSSVNEAGGEPVPAITFAEAFDLRVVPSSLDWCDAEGRRASMTLSTPPGFKAGHLLYMREDLLRKYCDQHDYELIWIVWGERDLWLAEPRARPEWLYEVYAAHAQVWRRVAALNEVAPA